LGAHLLLGTVAGIETALRSRDAGALLMAPVILAFHLAYGVGTCVGLVAGPPKDSAATKKQITGRPARSGGETSRPDDVILKV
jgi:hypothetical protein